MTCFFNYEEALKYFFFFFIKILPHSALHHNKRGFRDKMHFSGMQAVLHPFFSECFTMLMLKTAVTLCCSLKSWESPVWFIHYLRTHFAKPFSVIMYRMLPLVKTGLISCCKKFHALSKISVNSQKLIFFLTSSRTNFHLQWNIHALFFILLRQSYRILSVSHNLFTW